MSLECRISSRFQWRACLSCVTTSRSSNTSPLSSALESSKPPTSLSFSLRSFEERRSPYRCITSVSIPFDASTRVPSKPTQSYSKAIDITRNASASEYNDKSKHDPERGRPSIDTREPKQSSKATNESRIRRWEKNKEDKRNVNRALQDKSTLSYDWRVPLKLLQENTQIEEEDSPRRLIRKIVSGHAPIRGGKPVTKVVKPETWSQAALNQCVNDLVELKTPRVFVSRLLGVRRPRTSISTTWEVGQTLVHLFRQNEVRDCLSVEACNTAMFFFARHHMLANARGLLFTMEHLSLDIPNTTFKRLLGAAAHQKDLHTFTWLLGKMIARNYKADATTWTSFIECVEVPAVKASITREMQQIGIEVTGSVKKRLVNTNLRNDLVRFLAENGRSEDFLRELSLHNGPDWMSTRAGNIIINEVSQRMSLNAGLDLISHLQRLSFSPDKVTLNLLLAQSVKRNSISPAIQILERFENEWKLYPGEDAHQLLFLYAWKRGYLNVCRVLWTSACLHGFVTYKMQSYVQYSLRLAASQDRPVDEQPQRPTKRPGESAEVFRSLAGKFLLGLDPFQHCSVKPTQRALAASLASIKKARLRGALSQTLRDALSLDREWRIRQREDLEKKLAKPLPISLLFNRSPTPL